jgi:hypothetical protein
LDAESFRAAWTQSADELCTFPAEALSASALPEEAKDFLATAGLPVEAAPFLSFKPLPLRWLGEQEQRYPIGLDGNGDPLVVDELGVVRLIDHEAPTHAILVNSSVRSLAECLIAYRTLVSETVSLGGEDAYIDGRVPKHLIDALSASISASDPPAGQAATFWGMELSRLISEAP